MTLDDQIQADPSSLNEEQMQVVEAPPKPSTKRLASLDILRGFTIVGMLMADDAEPYGPWWMIHAKWNGLTLADLVFPSFVFIMGMAVPMSLTANNRFRLKNVTRILGLFAIGLILNVES